MKIREPKVARIGQGTVEHEPVYVLSDGMQVPESQLAEYNAAKKKPEPPRKRYITQFCPLKAGGRCTEDCVMYEYPGCQIHMMAKPMNNSPTAGKRCPFNGVGTCSENCALFVRGGCSILTMAKEGFRR